MEKWGIRRQSQTNTASQSEIEIQLKILNSTRMQASIMIKQIVSEKLFFRKHRNIVGMNEC